MNHAGDLVEGLAFKIKPHSALLAEAIAVRAAVVLLNNLKIDKAVICSENLVLIKSCNSSFVPWEIPSVKKDIQEDCARLTEVSFIKISRKDNTAVHWVAAKAGKSLLPSDWVHNIPEDLKLLLKKDFCNSYVWHQK